MTIKKHCNYIPMKKFLFIFTISLILSSCGGDDKSVDSLIENGNLTEIKEKKADLNIQQKELKAKIDKLNTYINKNEKKSKAQLVTTKKLNDTVFKHFVEVQGDVETDENIILFPEYSGVLTDVYVNEGDQVRKGQLLAKIDDGGLSSQLAQQETQAKLAKTTYERRKNLWDQKIGSEIQFLESKTNYEAAVQAADQTRSQLSKTRITAPFSGTIDDVLAEEGQVVNQGQTQVMRLIDLNDMFVTASVPENYLKSVKKGSEVLIELGAINEEYTGIIRQVGSFINPDNRKFNVEIEIPNPDGFIKPNMIATVLINNYTNQNAITIPEIILQENAQGESIAYLYEQQNDSTAIAKKVVLELGLSYENKIEVKKGLNPGDIIVMEGAKNLRDGQRITTKTN